ncbi:hypothetical protein BHE74_00003007 [Ensete ventricosum]|nr:hypothetical protein BHE74_00003007 [Ensete ventricosum]
MFTTNLSTARTKQVQALTEISARNVVRSAASIFAAASGTVTLGFLGFFCSSFFGAPYPVLLGSARGLHAAVIVLLVRRGRGRPRSGMALRRLRAFCSKESKPEKREGSPHFGRGDPRIPGGASDKKHQSNLMSS